jgi:nucleoside-diphosphate-sugar epimerase
MGWFNTIWQGDACAMTIRALEHAAAPPWMVNVTGPEALSVRTVAERLGRLMNRPVRFVGTEADTALLSDSRRALEAFGPPRVAADQLVEWVADWVKRGGRNLDKPTHFESRDGRF